MMNNRNIGGITYDIQNDKMNEWTMMPFVPVLAYKVEFWRMCDVKNGMKMAESLEDVILFPDLLVSMLRVGEETAQVGDTIIKIADFYDEEVDIAIWSIQKMIEPMILAVMAVVIGFIAIGIFQPIMNLAGTLSGG